MSAQEPESSGTHAIRRVPTMFLVRVLQDIVRADETHYEHHQPRRWDGSLPPEGSSIWLTPREIAIRALRSLGAAVPDALVEAAQRSARERP